MVRARLWRWALAALLAGASCWTGTLTLFNYWAADGPVTAHPEIYEQRGDVFLALTVAMLLSALLLFVASLRRRFPENDRQEGL